MSICTVLFYVNMYCIDDNSCVCRFLVRTYVRTYCTGRCRCTCKKQLDIAASCKAKGESCLNAQERKEMHLYLYPNSIQSFRVQKKHKKFSTDRKKETHVCIILGLHSNGAFLVLAFCILQAILYYSILFSFLSSCATRKKRWECLCTQKSR